jgi:hypothetical protein
MTTCQYRNNANHETKCPYHPAITLGLVQCFHCPVNDVDLELVTVIETIQDRTEDDLQYLSGNDEMTMQVANSMEGMDAFIEEHQWWNSEARQEALEQDRLDGLDPLAAHIRDSAPECLTGREYLEIGGVNLEAEAYASEQMAADWEKAHPSGYECDVCHGDHPTDMHDYGSVTVNAARDLGGIVSDIGKCSFDPTHAEGGMFHCPECGEMVVAGMAHPDYSILDNMDNLPCTCGGSHLCKDHPYSAEQEGSDVVPF